MGGQPALSEPAARLWSPLPPDARIAVRPLDPDASGLPAALLGVAERSLVAALVASAPTGGVVLTRSELPAVWEERESFTGTDAKVSWPRRRSMRWWCRPWRNGAAGCPCRRS